MNNPSQLPQRIVTAVILIAAFVAILFSAMRWCGGRWLLSGLAVVAASLSSLEASRLVPALHPVQRYLTLLVLALPAWFLFVCLFVIGLCSAPQLYSPLPLVFVLVSLVSIVLAVAHTLVSARDALDQAERHFAAILPAVLLVGVGGGSFVGLSALPNAPWLIAWLVLVVALNDVAAYFGGRHFGGRKLAAAISPNKTVSGSLCGIVAGALAGTWAREWLAFQASLLFFVAFSMLIVLLAQAGDLLKSYLKRVAKVKDSGTILPGHGGVLDRVDGELFAAPFLYLAVVTLLRF